MKHSSAGRRPQNHSVTVEGNGSAKSQPGVTSEVVQVRQLEDELDAAIAELGDCAHRAMSTGDPAGAAEYAQRMNEAIRQRTPEHQARLARELDRRVQEAIR